MGNFAIDNDVGDAAGFSIADVDSIVRRLTVVA
jgi:hypothetical protein